MRHPYGDIPELTELQAGGPLVRIPDRLNVPFTPRVRAVVDTAEFQRLAHISQLGLAAKVYPGATHTRFEHALGVFHNACRYLWQLGKDARFAATVDAHDANVLLAAALLHDIGHWPFCHPLEDMHLSSVPPHEHFAAEFLRPDRELGEVLLREWQVTPDEVLDLLCARTDSATHRLMRSILSGPIDIDKLDYLERDSLHAGVPYGRNFDRERLIQSLVLNAAGDGLAISSKGKTAAELMVFARYVMFSEVYWHHAVRSATCMLARSFYEVHERLDLRQLFALREPEFIAALQRAASETSAAGLLDGLFGPKRRLHKRVLEFSLEQAPDLYRLLAGRKYVDLLAIGTRLTERLRSEHHIAIGPTDLLIDAPPVHKEVEFRVDIYFPKEDRYRPLGEVSPVVAALAKTQFDDYVKRVRLFATADVAGRLGEVSDLSAMLSDAAG
ncbi:MAG TPA: HD domain-containing protein [Planctomycetaceae bacterium]|nr:HD domain-containing protein [Planctomycetaceae bacterium]